MTIKKRRTEMTVEQAYYLGQTRGIAETARGIAETGLILSIICLITVIIIFVWSD